MSIETKDHSKLTGQVIGVYNERPFMWNPKDRDTIALFKCKQPDMSLDSFTTFPVSDNSVFTLNTDEITSIKVVEPLDDDVITYEEYMQRHGVLIHHQIIKVICLSLGLPKYRFIFNTGIRYSSVLKSQYRY